MKDMKKSFYIFVITLSVIYGQVQINHAPEWVRDMSDLELREDRQFCSSPDDARAGRCNDSLVYTLLATDDQNAQLYYSMKADHFLIGSATIGDVYLIQPIDYESNHDVEVTVVVTDGENEIERSMKVNIIDVNDEAPRFSQSTYATDVPEDAAVGSVVPNINITVTDNDGVNQRVDVTCMADRNAEACQMIRLVKDDGNNLLWKGHMVLQQKLDFEVKSIYQIPLQAFDGINAFIQTIIVRVEDVQDSPPIFTGTSTAVMDEEQPVNYLIKTVLAEDGDRGIPREIRYSIVPELSDRNSTYYLRIDPVSGEIRTKTVFDRDRDPSFQDGTLTIIVKAQEMYENGTLGNDPLTTATTQITITVNDLNDNAPTFSQANYPVYIDENIPNDSPLPGLVMSVNDVDQGSNAHFKVTLLDHTDTFSIDPNIAEGQSGQVGSFLRIKNTDLIDYDRGIKDYTLRVVVYDNEVVQVLAAELYTTTRQSSTATVHVTVRDVNDNDPVFDRTSYTAELSELAAPNDIVIDVTARDIDSGIFGQQGLRYSLEGVGSERFYIENSTGLIRVAPCAGRIGVAPCIDHESIREKSYDLVIQASDELGIGPTARTDNSRLRVTVLDENDNPPVFTQQKWKTSIEEGKRNPDPPLVIQAGDRDSSLNGNNHVEYSLVNPDNLLPFTIDRVTGNITGTRPMVYDPRSGDEGTKYSFVVQAKNGPFISSANVEITVLDINNHAPEFRPDSRYRTSIDETTPPGTAVLQVLAIDQDGGRNAEITFEMTAGPSDKFNVDPSNGTILVASRARFDYDRTKQYNLTITASDDGNPKQSSTAFVIIDILDKNNKNPRFRPQSKAISIFENKPVGETVIQMTAEDPDLNANLQYSFVQPITASNVQGQDVDPNVYDFTNLFSIDPRDGVVRVARPLNRDEVKDFVFTVQARDISASTPQIGQGILRIELLDVNDKPPVFVAPWTSTNPVYNINVREETDSYVMTLQATDPDGQVSEYKLVEDPDQLFAVDALSGEVTLTTRLDYESIQQTRFAVQAFDNGEPQLNSTATVHVKVVNINDNKPIFNKESYVANLTENSPGDTPVLTLSADDADLGDFGQIRYSINEPQNRFIVDPVSGIVRVRRGAVLDREDKENTQNGLIVVIAQATDSPDPRNANVRRSTSAPVYIQLTDVNDNDPIFTEDNFVTTIIETVPVNAFIFQISANDKDLGENARVTYNFGNDAPNELFALNETTGSLSTNKSLVGHSGTYRFTVEATDHGIPERRVSLTRVVITVLATNQRAPRWIWPAGNNQTIEVLENQYVGLVVTDKPYAVDDDDGPSGKITYGFYDNRFVKETPEFTINPITGVISAKVIFDREEKDTYTLLLVARDNGQPPLQSNRYLTVKVLDVNDNPPSFPTFQNGSTIPVTFFVPEGVKDYFVGQVNATDKDTGRYADIYYYIDGGNFNNSFKIDNRTGRIVTNKALDRETISKFVLTVRVTNNLNDDNVINVNEEPYPNPTYVMVTIIVTDTNDNGPIFTLNEYYAFVPLRAPFWYLVTDEISATDKDGGSNGNVTFRIDQTIVSKEDTNIIYTVDNAMTIGLLNATVYTISLMDNYKDVRFDMVIDASDSGEIPRSMKSNLKVWVADETNEIVLLIKQPPYWVRRYKEKIIQLITSIVGAKTVFIDESEIRFHQVGDYVNEKWTDVVIYVVDNKTNFLMDGKAVAATLKGKLTGDEKGAFALLHVADAQPGVAAASTGGGVDWGALAGAIAALLALLLLLLLLLCCCLPCCAKCCGGCCAPVGAGAGKEKLAAVSAGAGTGAGYGYGAGSAYGYDSFNNQAFEFDELHSTGGVVAVAGGGAGGYSHEERIEREQFEFASMERSGVEQAVEAADEVDANYTIVAGLAGGEQGAAAAQGTDEYTIVAGLAGGEHGGQAQIAESAFVGTIHATTAGGTSTMRSGGSSNGGVTIRTGQSSMNHVDSGPAASVYSESIYSSRDGSAYGVPVGTAGFTIQTTETRMAAPPPVAGFTIQTTETTRAAPPPTAGFTIQTTETQRAAPPPQTAGFTIQTTETQRAAPPPQTAGFTIQTTEKVTSSQPPPPPPQPTGQSWHSGSLTFRPEVGSPVPQHGMTVHTEEVVQQHAPPMVQSPNGTLHSGSLTFRADDLPSQRSAGGTMHTGSVTIRPEDLPDAHLAGVHAPLTGVHTTTTYGRSTVHPDDHVRTGTMVSGGSNTVRTGTMQSKGRANSFTHSGSGGPYTSVENGFTVVHPQ